MKWFKHDADASRDAKLKRVLIRYGLEGYGLYWFCLELIAGTIDKHNLTFELEHDAEIIGHDTGMHREKVQEIMTFMVDLGLFESRFGVISCIKMAKRLDSSMTSDKAMRDAFTNLRLQNQEVIPSQETVMTLSCKNRTEENRIDTSKSTLAVDVFNFWCDKMGKANNAKLTAGRRSKILARIKEGYPIEEIKQAIENCARSDFHMGQNDNGTKYNDLELICRSGAKLEFFRDMSGAISDNNGWEGDIL